MKKIALVLLILLMLMTTTACGLLNQLTCEHQYVEETVAPTCSKKGYVKKTCTLCEKVTYEDIDRLPHTLSMLDTVAPTCTSDGYTNYKCIVCGETEKKDIVPAIPHSFNSETVAPTCTTQGYTLNTCSVCGTQQKTDIVNPIPHTYSDQVIPPSCTSGGYTQQTCTVCGATNKADITDQLPHNLVSQVYQPTCTEQGYTYQKCQDCSFEENVNYVDALGHKWNGWVTDTPATEVSDGKKSRTCNVCGEVETQVIPSVTYTDNSALRLQWDPSQVQKVNTVEELSAYFNSAVLNHYTTTTFDVAFEVTNDTLQTLVDNCNVPFAFGLQSSLKTTTSGGSKTYQLTLTLTLNNQTPTASTTGSDYTQIASANKSTYTPTRSNSWDDFAYNQRSLTVTVSSSEQLWYVLEQGGKPIATSGSPAEKMLGKMKAVLRQICDDQMTDVQKVLAIHDWVIAEVNYDHKLLEMMEAQLSLPANERQSLSHYDAFFLEGVFNNNKAVCEGIAKAVACLCNIEGLPCVTVEGVPAGNPGGVGHAWNKVLMDGKWYIVDATSDNLMLTGENKMEVAQYTFFGLTDSQYSQHYVATSRQDIVCNTQMDVFAQLTYKYYSTTADFVIVSPAELTTLVRHLWAQQGIASVQFVVGFDVGASAQDEIVSALQQVGASSGSVNFVEDGNVYVVIKNK